MSFLPASFEILAYILFAPMLLGITRLEAAVVMILLALCVRAVGVLLALAGTRLDWKERLFCVIAYLPKATVQAAIGSGAAGNGSALRSSGALGGSAGDPYHSAAGSHRHRQYLPPSAASRRLIFPFSPNKKPELSAQESSGFWFISQGYRISTCSAFMALRAFSWASGVTPAQQLARTVMGTSGQ